MSKAANKLNQFSMRDWKAYDTRSEGKKYYLQWVKLRQRELYGHIENNNDWYMKDELKNKMNDYGEDLLENKAE